MTKKYLMASICMALSLVSVRPAVADPHPMTDAPANGLNAGILVQSIMAVTTKVSELSELVKQYTSMGGIGAILSQLQIDDAWLNMAAKGVGYGMQIADAAGDIKGVVDTVGDSVDMLKDGNYAGAMAGATSAFGAGTQLAGKAGSAIGSTAIGSSIGNAVASSGVGSVVSDAVSGGKNLVAQGKEVYAQGEKIYGQGKEVYDAGGKLVDAGKGLYNSGKGAIANAKKTVSDVTGKVVGIASEPALLANTGFSEAMSDAGKMRSFVAEELLPPLNEDAAASLTDNQKRERYKKRQAVLAAAVGDAYSLAVSKNAQLANAAKEVVQPVQKIVGGAEDLQAKQGAGNDVAIARLQQAIDANMYSATSLMLQAAEAMASLPVDYAS